MSDELTIDLRNLETGEVFEVDFGKLIELVGDLYERPQVMLETLYKQRMLIVNLKTKAKEKYADVKADFDNYVGQKTKLYSKRQSENPLYVENAKITNNTVEKAVEATEEYKQKYAEKKKVKAYYEFLNDVNFLLAELLSFAKAVMVHDQIDQMDFEKTSKEKKEEFKDIAADIMSEKPEV